MTNIDKKIALRKILAQSEVDRAKAQLSSQIEDLIFKLSRAANQLAAGEETTTLNSNLAFSITEVVRLDDVLRLSRAAVASLSDLTT